MSRCKLLVVDDSRAVRVAVSRMLSAAGYEVITANDGLEAVELLAYDPSLIVLDVNMPGLDGYGVCERIRAVGSEYSRLPVVFLTSVESQALQLLGREFGAYLRKPVMEQELLSVIETQLALASS
jgi:CheY-like chemotaxis protein